MDLSYEYGIRPRGKGKVPPQFPFQTQLKFTRLDGTEVLRVVSSFNAFNVDIFFFFDYSRFQPTAQPQQTKRSLSKHVM